MLHSLSKHTFLFK